MSAHVDQPTREQVEGHGHLKPDFGRPGIGEVRDPLSVRPIGAEVVIEGVGGKVRLRPYTHIRRRTPPAQARPQCEAAHQAFDTLTPAIQSGGQYVAPHPPRAIDAIARQEARPDRLDQCDIVEGTIARRPRPPSVEARPRDTGRLVHPAHRPYPSVIRHEADPFAKKAAVFRGCRAWPSVGSPRGPAAQSPVARASSARAPGTNAADRRSAGAPTCAARSRGCRDPGTIARPIPRVPSPASPPRLN